MSLLLLVKLGQRSEDEFWQASDFPQSKFIAKKRLHQGQLLFSRATPTKELINTKLSKSSIFFTDMSGTSYFSNIKWCKVESFTERSSEGFLYGFTIFKLNLQQDFFVATADALDEWMLHLSKVCVLTGFKHDYAKIRKIDSGKFGKVYLCEDMLTREQFAVKRIKKEIIKAPKCLNHLYNEVSILRKLDHPNIIKIFKVYEDKFSISLILEYVPYGNLYSRIQKRIKLAQKEAIIFSKKLFETLRYLHSKGIMHRDLKLENILMTSQTSEIDFKLCDFGLACYVDRSLRTKSGSPGYMAPEILRGNSYSTKADIFSAGVVLYILISGTSPFNSDNSEKVIKSNAECKVSFAKKEFRSISSLTIKFIAELLNPEPTFRPTADQVLSHVIMQLITCSESSSLSFTTLNLDVNEKGILKMSY